MAEIDDACTAKGIPNHLHTGGRAVDVDFDGMELAYIRFPMEERKLTSVLNFRHRSFNRSKYSSQGPDDLLWNSEEGGRYEGLGVAALSIAAIREVQAEIPGPPLRKITRLTRLRV
jgi:hypothetical protein